MTLARDLQGRETHRAGAAMDQHGLAFLQARQMHERVVGGEEGDRQGGGGLEGEVGRQRAHREGRGHDVAGKAAGHEGDDAVANLVFERLGPDSAHDAGAFHAQRRTGIAVFQRFFRQEAQVPHHVTEVEAGRDHLDLDLAGAGHGARHGRPGKRATVRAGARHELQSEVVAQLRWRRQRRSTTGQAEDQAFFAPEEDLALVGGRDQFLGDASRRGRCRGSGEAQAMDLEGGVLVLCDAHCGGQRAPERAGQRDQRGRRLGVAEIQDQPQPRRVGAEVAAPVGQARQQGAHLRHRGASALGIDRPDDIGRCRGLGGRRSHRAGVRQGGLQGLAVGRLVAFPGEDRRLGNRLGARFEGAGKAVDDDADALVAEQRPARHCVEAGAFELIRPFARRQQSADREGGVGRTCPPFRADAAHDVPEQAGGRLTGQQRRARAQQAPQSVEAVARCRDLAQGIDGSGEVEGAARPGLEVAPGHAADVLGVVVQGGARLVEAVGVEVGDHDVEAGHVVQQLGGQNRMLGADQ